MKEKIYLFYHNSNHRGPGAVVNNLLKGLKGIGAEVVGEVSQADFAGCLQHPGANYDHFPTNTLMGPNLFVIPDESKDLCNKYQNFIVPSEWVKNLYFSFDIMKEKKIDVWSVGIDTENWQQDKSLSQDNQIDCFIYYKNRTQQDLALIYKLCLYFKLKFELIEYGSYKEEQLRNLCNRSKFAILLTGTESQGIAYMNILSMNIPCYVFENSMWIYDKNKEIKMPATSVPYFDNKCGVITKNLDIKDFQSFILNVEKNLYTTREYIIQNHTLEQSANKYVDLLKGINNV